MTVETIAGNIASIAPCSNFRPGDGPTDAVVMLDNAEWLTRSNISRSCATTVIAFFGRTGC